LDIETRELFMKLFNVIERFEINFKTEITETKEEIKGMKADIAEMKADIAEMKVEIAEMKKEISELKTEMIGLKNEQAKTNERLDALSSLYGFHEVAIQRLKQKMIL